MRAQDEEAHHLGIEALQHLAHGEEVAERLRHLLLVDAQETVVHPVIDELDAVRALGLRDLVLVVRELQVLAAAVDVEMLAEQRAAHGGAFDVPARPPFAVARRPLRLVGLGALPEHEVERVFLGGVDLDALAGAQLVERFPRQPAVPGKAAHGEVDVARGRAVSEPFLFQAADHVDHLRNVLRRARLVIGLLHAERRCVFVYAADEARGQLADRFAVLERTADDPVVDVGDVAHVGDAIAARAQPALHDIEDHQHARMAEVQVVVHRHAADVHAHLAGPQRNEFLLGPAQGVVDLQHGSRRRESCGGAGVSLECSAFVGP